MSASQPVNSAEVRREICFLGRVQGVGFRATTRNIARRFAVTGIVENLPNGQVRLIAEAAAAELDRFVNSVRRELERHIDGAEELTAPATGEFAGFTIRY